MLACCFPPSVGKLVKWLTLGSGSFLWWLTGESPKCNLRWRGRRVGGVIARCGLLRPFLKATGVQHTQASWAGICTPVLERAADASQARSTFQAHPIPGPAGGPWAPAAWLRVNPSGVSLLFCTHTHVDTHVQGRSTSLLCVGTCHHLGHRQNKAQAGCVRQEWLTRQQTARCRASGPEDTEGLCFYLLR